MGTLFETIFADYTKNQGFSGTCLIKTEREVLFSGVTGYAHRGFRIPNKMDTKFDTASVTKTFTAAAILQLVERGLLNLDDLITEVIDLSGAKIPRDVKIEHLLNHTSGIADDADEEAGEIYSDLFITKPNYGIRECKDYLPNFAYKEPNFRAGTAERYNNCAFILLGLALEKVTGTDFRTYVTENIFEASGMMNSKFCGMDEINDNTAEGYDSVFRDDGSFDGFRKNIYNYPPKGAPDGGAYTTVEDLDIFIRAIKNRTLLSETYSTMLLTPHSQFTRPATWQSHSEFTVRRGYGFEFLERDHEIYGVLKDGVCNGVAALLAYYPMLDVTIAILANQNCNVWAMHREFQKIIGLSRVWG